MSVPKTTPAQIRACAREGLSLLAAAERLGVSYRALKLRAWRLGISFERQRRSPLRDKVVAAIQAGAETSFEIATATGIERPMISVTLNRAEERGLVRRVPGTRGQHFGRPAIRWRLTDAEARP